ncbi:MAG TPA: DsbA family protein [Paucimonas sp.]|nr:DsbA family protein [Paucimonas sp.]
MPSLIYVADPMCSWCYGFAPELVTLLQGLPDIPVDIVVGGLRAYNKEALGEQMHATLREHWQRVAGASNLQFAPDHPMAPGFVYDTEPACRAVVTARALAPSATLSVFHAIQYAFYAEGRDVTQADVLAEAASRELAEAGFSIAPAAFREKWMTPEMVAETAADFGQTRRWGVSGFPTLILERDGKLDLVTSGYVKTEQLVEQMQALVDREAVPG